MGLVALEFLERRQIGILVAESDDEANHHLIVVEVVEEGAAIGVVLERPAGRVDHEAGLVPRGIDLPELLDAEAEDLRIGVLAERVALAELAAEMAARALAEQRVFRVQLHAELEMVGRLAVAAESHVAGGHALDRAVVVVEDFAPRGKPGKISTPSASACWPSQRTTLARLIT